MSYFECCIVILRYKPKKSFSNLGVLSRLLPEFIYMYFEYIPIRIGVSVYNIVVEFTS